RGKLQSQQLAPEAAQDLTPTLELSLTTPFTYISKVIGTARVRQDDGHFNPDMSVLATKPFPEFVLSAFADVKSDRFVKRPDSDVDELKFELVASYTGWKALDGSLYASYAPALTFAPDFGSGRAFSTNDFALGVHAKRF